MVVNCLVFVDNDATVPGVDGCKNPSRRWIAEQKYFWVVVERSGNTRKGVRSLERWSDQTRQHYSRASVDGNSG